jgi:2-phosphoglycerate kinase
MLLADCRRIIMIYLIGGSPRVGKTKLAEALARKTSFPYFSLDHVTSVITPYIPEQEYETKLPLFAARLKKETVDVFYARRSTEQIVNFYLGSAEIYWAGVANFIRYAVEDEHDLILEGWQILPHLLQTLGTPEHQDKLKIIFLYKSNVENIVSGIKANTAKIDWVLRNTKEESTFLAIAKMISYFGNYIEKEAKEYNFRSVNTDVDFEQKIKESLEFISV